MTSIAEIRQQYPQYDDMSDQQLADAFHQTFYSDMPQADFYSKIGFTTQPASTGHGTAYDDFRDGDKVAPYGASEVLARMLGVEKQKDDPRDSFLGKVDATMRGAADTMSFGFADEIAAGGDALFNPIFGSGQDGESFSDRYNANLKQQRGIDDADYENRFGYRLGGQLAGAVTGGLGMAKSGLSASANAVNAGKSLGTVTGASIKEGAILGGLHGFGSGEGGIDSRLLSTGKGLASGAVIGGAMPIVVSTISKALGSAAAPVMSRIYPENYAYKVIAEGAKRSGKTPNEVAQAMHQAQLEGQDLFAVADALGNSGERMMSTVVRNPHNERQAVVDFLQQRQAGQGDRLSNFLAEGFSAPDTAAQRAANLRAQRNATVNANDEAARKTAAGAVDPSAAIQAADDFLIPGSAQIMNPGNNIADNSIETAVRRARSYLMDGKSVLSDFNSAFRAKMELDAMIDSAYPTIQSKLIPIRNALDNALESASPAYAKARDTLRQQSQAIDAIDLGKNAASGRMHASDTVSQFKNLAPDAQDAFRAGYVDPLIARIENQSLFPAANKAEQLMTPKMRVQIPAFASTGKGDRLTRQIQREQRMFETSNAAFRDFKAADIAADAVDRFQLDPSIVEKLASGNVPGALAEGAAKVVNKAFDQTSPVSERMAKMLMETNPKLVKAMLERGMNKLSRAEQVRAKLLSVLARSGSSATPRILGERPHEPLMITIGGKGR